MTVRQKQNNEGALIAIKFYTAEMYKANTESEKESFKRIIKDFRDSIITYKKKK